MAIINEIDLKAYNKWYHSRPESIQNLVDKIPPGRLYLYKPTGQRVFPYSYCEDGTLTVVVSGEYNFVTFERRVFGIEPKDLEECDLPGEGENLGVLIPEGSELDKYIEAQREDYIRRKNDSGGETTQVH